MCIQDKSFIENIQNIPYDECRAPFIKLFSRQTQYKGLVDQIDEKKIFHYLCCGSPSHLLEKGRNETEICQILTILGISFKKNEEKIKYSAHFIFPESIRAKGRIQLKEGQISSWKKDLYQR